MRKGSIVISKALDGFNKIRTNLEIGLHHLQVQHEDNQAALDFLTTENQEIEQEQARASRVLKKLDAILE